MSSVEGGEATVTCEAADWQATYAVRPIGGSLEIASVLIELDRRTGFLDCFTHAGGATPRSRELKRNLLAA